MTLYDRISGGYQFQVSNYLYSTGPTKSAGGWWWGGHINLHSWKFLFLAVHNAGLQTTLWFTDKILLQFSKSLSNYDETNHMVEGPRCIAFKPDDENIFLVGTEEGGIYLGAIHK